MRIKPRTIMFGILIYLAHDTFVTSLRILEVTNENLFLSALGLMPWITIAAALGIAVLAVTVNWDEVL